MSVHNVQNHLHLGLIVETDGAFKGLLYDFDAHFALISDIYLVKRLLDTIF